MKSNIAPPIHVYTKYFYPVAAGIETNILETYRVIAQRGTQVIIHTTKDQYTQKNSLADNETIKGLIVKRRPFINEVKGYIQNMSWEKGSIVAIHNFNLYYLWMFIKVWQDKITDRKTYTLIVTPHGGFVPQWSMFPIGTRIVKWIYHNTLGVWFLNNVVDKIRAVSAWEKKEMVHLGVHENKIHVITNGLEDEAFMDVDAKASIKIKQLVQSLGTYIVQIGRIYPIKNYETVIRALPSVPDVNYVIVGQEELNPRFRNYKAHLARLAHDLGVDNRLHFVGVMRGVDKYYVIKHARLMVHMALWESFCNVVHEGLSQGCVCIVANNTALPLLIKNGINGFVIETKDYTSLANKINFVLSHERSKEIQVIKNNAMRQGRNDTWKNVAHRMYALYYNTVI